MEFRLTENGIAMETGLRKLHISLDEAHGFRPFQLMIGSLAGCSILVLKNVLQKMRISFNDITVQADVERNEAKANRIEKIQLHFIIKGNDLPKEKVARALNLARKNCAMVQSVEGSIDVKETYEIVEGKERVDGES